MINLEKMYMDEYDDILYADIRRPEGVAEPNIVDELVTQGVTAFKQDVEEKPLESAMAIPKGMVQGSAGALGDIESIIRGVVAAVKTPEGKEWLDSFIEGMEQETMIPNVEDFRNMLNKYLGPTEATAAESAGEIVGVGGVVKGAAKGISGAAKRAMKKKAE
jgi:hypothetical protein